VRQRGKEGVGSNSLFSPFKKKDTKDFDLSTPSSISLDFN